MYPSRFRYEAPRSLDEAIRALHDGGDSAKVLAGGQSLVPLMKLRFASPELVVDINNVPGLDYHRADPDGTLRIGALCRHADLECSGLLKTTQPTMAAAAPLIADPIVRNRGTLVGSLCHADPQGDWASVVLALGGSVVAAGPRGRRTIPLAGFVTGPFENVLDPDEIAVEAVIPAAKGTRAGGYLKLERRVGDFATVGVAVALETAGGNVTRAGIALTGVGGSTIAAAQAAQALTGRPLTADGIAQAADLAAQAARPGDRPSRQRRVKAPHGARLRAADPEPRGRRGRKGRLTMTIVYDDETGEAESTVPVCRIRFTVNGQKKIAEVEPRLLLAHLIRRGLGLTGTHMGCDTTNCGACTVLVDGRPVKSCTMLAVQADGHEISTVEGLATASELHPLQEGFKEEHGLQCGFCTPGMMMAAKALLAENPDPTGESAVEALSTACGAARGFRRGQAVMFVGMADESDVLAGLNSQQQRAVTHQGGPLLVLAGAGTGKTRTLVARAAWLRDCQGVQASRILLLTFTRRAASEMLARAASGTDSAAERICGGTFHAIAHKIIRQHAESFSLPPQFTVIDPADAAEILDVLRPDHGLADAGQRTPRAATCADIYTRCVNTGRPVSEVVTASFPWCVPFTGQLADLFRAYTARKRARHLLDFDDLLLLWQAALADPVAGPVLRGMFDAVLVDEYQDVNAVQASIVRLLQPDGKQLTCVGDDAQAIYGFRGSDPAHLRQLAADYPSLEIVRLNRNYRSRQGVLDLANVIRPGLELTLAGDRGAGTPPLLVRCHDEATQAREICARVLDACSDGSALRDQAVLVRAAHHSDILEIELSARKIPYVKYGGLRFTDTAHVRDFLAAARILANPADDLAWFRLLRLHEGIGPVHARRILARLDVPGDSGGVPPADWPQAVQAAPARSRAALAATLRGLASAAGSQAPAGGSPAAAQAAAILEVLDPLIRARYPDAATRLADLHRLAGAAAAAPSLQDALAELTLDPPVSASDLAGPPRLDEDFLTISTIHAAKGLEWPVVHLPHLVDGALPSDMALGDPNGLAEEHRLFYVALTRARDHLYLYAPLRLHLHRRGRDDRHGLGQLTRFLHKQALAACDTATAAPPAPLIPAAGPLTVKVDAALGSLWS